MTATGDTDQISRMGAARGFDLGAIRAQWLRLWRSPAMLFLLAASAGYVMGWHFLLLFQADWNGNVMELGARFIYFEEMLFHVPLFLGIAALFLRQVDGRVLLALTFLAFWFNNNNIISHDLHGLLDSWHLYPEAFRHGRVDGPINVQYAILTCYAVVYPLLWLTVLMPSRRTMSRIFVLLILTVILGTTTLFHQVVIDRALVTAVNEERSLRLQYLENIADVPDEASFMTLCRRWGGICETGSMASAPHDPAGVPDFLRGRIARAHEASQLRGKDSLSVSEAQPVGALDADLRGRQFVFHRDGDRWRLAVDMSSYNHIPARYKIYFGALMIAAHLWWVYGGFGLLAFHRSRFAWRFARKTQAEAAG